jgi:hypothetical protein
MCRKHPTNSTPISDVKQAEVSLTAILDAEKEMMERAGSVAQHNFPVLMEKKKRGWS